MAPAGVREPGADRGDRGATSRPSSVSRPGIPVAAGGGDNAAAAIGTAVTRDGPDVELDRDERRAVRARGRVRGRPVGADPRLRATRCRAGTACSPSRSRRAGRCGGGGTSRASTTTSWSPRPSPSRPAPRGSCSSPISPGSARPTWIRRPRGGFVGLTARHTRGHMTRALMEGVAVQPPRRPRDHARPRRASHADPRDRRRRVRASCGCSSRPTSTAPPCIGSRSRRARRTGRRCSGTSRPARSPTSTRPRPWSRTLDEVTEPDPDARRGLRRDLRGLSGPCTGRCARTCTGSPSSPRAEEESWTSA